MLWWLCRWCGVLAVELRGVEGAAIYQIMEGMGTGLRLILPLVPS